MLGNWRTNGNERITIRPANGKATPTNGKVDAGRVIGKPAKKKAYSDKRGHVAPTVKLARTVSKNAERKARRHK